MRFRRLKVGDWVKAKSPYSEIRYGQLHSKRKDYWFDKPIWMVNYLNMTGFGEYLSKEITRLTDAEAALVVLEIS